MDRIEDDPAFIEAVARRVVELLDDGDDRHAVDEDHDLLTVAEVARRYRVRPNWVYAHQRELGVIRLGHGPKARLRFDPDLLPSRLTGELLALPEAAPARRPAPRRRLQRSLSASSYRNANPR